MRHALTTTLLSSLLTLGAASAAAGPPAPTVPDAPAHRVVDLAIATGDARPVKVLPLYDEPHLKLATITLRDGAVMASHSAPMPVTIVALAGEADIVYADGARERVTPSRLIALQTNVAHSVEPVGKDTVVLLVHHMKQRPAPPAP